jgi:hypothetical protein
VPHEARAPRCPHSLRTCAGVVCACFDWRILWVCCPMGKHPESARAG